MRAPPPRPWRRREGGFTLVELLAAIAIIGVLAAILIPVTGMVRRSAATAGCLSNLRQAGVAFQLHLADNKQLYPRQPAGVVAPGGGATWWENVGPYADWRAMRAGPDAAFGTFMHCPAHTEQPGSFSYRANHYIIVPPTTARVLASAVVNPARKILLYETHTHCEWPSAGYSYGGQGKAPFLPPYANHSHASLSNHLFADGHVASSADSLAHVGTWWQPFVQ